MLNVTCGRAKHDGLYSYRQSGIRLLSAIRPKGILGTGCKTLYLCVFALAASVSWLICRQREDDAEKQLLNGLADCSNGGEEGNTCWFITQEGTLYASCLRQVRPKEPHPRRLGVVLFRISIFVY